MTGDLPPPNQRNVDLLAQYFSRKGLTLDDMILLLGAHSLGVAHCGTFDYRLTSDQDKGMDAAFRNSLRSQCRYNASNYVPFDAESPYALDTGYFANVLANRTLLESDAALAAHRGQGEAVEGQPGLVREQLRGRHGQDGQHARHQPRQGPPQLHQGQDLIWACMGVDMRSAVRR
jgi:hypothetical protein